MWNGWLELMKRVMKTTLGFACLLLVAYLETSAVLASDGQTPIVDGIINDNEYPRQIQEPITEIKIYWYNDEIHLYIGLVSPGLGWIAIAFDPTYPDHYETNIIIGYVVDGQLFIWDHYGTGATIHESDETLGGTNDILESAGTELEGRTIVEFKIPLNSSDAYDKTLEPNETYTIIVAYHSTADYLASQHTATGIITIETIPEFPSTVIILSVFMLGTLLVLTIHRRKSPRAIYRFIKTIEKKLA